MSEIHSMDEILNLGDAIVKDINEKDINEAVARKMGWEQKGAGWQSPLQQEKYPEWSDIEPLDYCHSIEAAWEITEKTPYVYLFKLGTGEWECKFSFADDPEKYERAATAPMAICLAFLKLP